MRQFEKGFAARVALAIVVAFAACRSDTGIKRDAGVAGTEARARAGVEDPTPSRALEITRSTRIPSGSHFRPSAPIGERSAAIVIRDQEGIVLDLAGAEIYGSPRGTDPDEVQGTGILIERSKDVTIKGGTIRGYKGGIVAYGCENLVIDGVKFDDGYASRLLSTALAEDQSDWLYPHNNDRDEWNRNYGGAISLTDCRASIVRDCRGRHMQNGILLTRTSGSQVYDNDFSFLSGWGLAMYRSSENVVSRNCFDYCVRGYSHDVYWRGQDSAGILMFERCSDNLFAFNSATHGGDGLFLFGGNDLVQGRAADRGEVDAGGSDRNVWYRNDFSYAVANALEATFSADNWVIENDLSHSHQHGIWGGYSSRMVIVGNRIGDTLGGGVSIEHGQECVIARNRILANDIGVELWWDEDPDLVNGPFGDARDTSSRDHWIIDNYFADNGRDLVLKKTSGLRFVDNNFVTDSARIRGEGIELQGGKLERGQEPRDLLTGIDGSFPSGIAERVSVSANVAERPLALKDVLEYECPPVPGDQVTDARERGLRLGLDTIVMGEWGPWDYASGDPEPKRREPGGLLADARWEATWFTWRDRIDPRSDVTAWRALAAEPLAQATVDQWLNPWSSDAIRTTVGNDRFGMIASTRVVLDAGGKHRLVVVSDDGVRVKIDGMIALENWTWHAPTRDESEIDLAAGPHRIEIEYFQIDGAAALSIELERIGG